MSDHVIITNETLSKLTHIFEQSPPITKAGDHVMATRILDCHCILGEGIIYDDEYNNLVWTDIDNRTFHKLDLATGLHIVYKLDKMLGSFALLPSNHSNDQDNNTTTHRSYLCAWEDGFQLYDIEKGEPISEMSKGEPVNPLKLPSRLNDGRVDPSGKRFICGGHNGDLSTNGENVYMKVYKCETITTATTTTNTTMSNDTKHLQHVPIVDQIRTTNSICFSPDGTIMYLADSPTKQINKYRYDPKTGTISNKTPLITYDIGLPDGSCIDSNGNLWNAVWRNGEGPSMVRCICNQTGTVLLTVSIPDNTSQITCCCFGGVDLDVLFITTASVGMDNKKEPFAGCLYAIKLNVKGCLEKRFRGS